MVFATGSLSSLMGFASLVFMTRYLGAEDYRTLAWATAFVAVFPSSSTTSKLPFIAIISCSSFLCACSPLSSWNIIKIVYSFDIEWDMML